jgi:predicted CXXCH cytochrome family protein
MSYHFFHKHGFIGTLFVITGKVIKNLFIHETEGDIMRSVLVLCFMLLFMAAAGTGLAQNSIVGTMHDFTGHGWSGGEICVVCHTPHQADLAETGAPLWNHEITIATFQLYSSATLNATVGQPDGNSKLCLSCHDGTVGVDNFGGLPGGTYFVTGDYNIGTDLRDDHPVSFVYDATLATDDGGLFDPTTTNSGVSGGTIDEDMLFNTKLQCASCHDVHGNMGHDYLLLKSNAGSALCLTCHDK